MVADTHQNVIINDNVMVIPSTLPVKPTSAEIYDTSTDYKKERINYGRRYIGIVNL